MGELTQHCPRRDWLYAPLGASLFIHPARVGGLPRRSRQARRRTPGPASRGGAGIGGLARRTSAQALARREATSYRAMPVATAALRDSTVEAIGMDTI